MIRLLVPALLLLSACSTLQHPDQWRYDAAAATRAYGNAFLKGDDLMAEADYQAALRAAQQSADLLPLARLQLSRCALNRAVLIEDPCHAYRELSDLVDAPELVAYDAMLAGTLRRGQLESLPEQYRLFARARLNGDASAALSALQSISPLSSKMVAASTATELVDEATVTSIIDEASYRGYRRAVIAWMRHLAETTRDPRQKASLEKKLEVLGK